uniref:Polyprotein n=1 Tax=Silene betaflexivirus 1 TaxID=2794409 RepID=A0A7T5QZ85_9VIRU|nr:polyprotein [Silene betaflexivirus 1]
MAFQYRNTLDSSLSALPQKYSDQIFAEVGDQIEKKVLSTSKLFSFRTSPEVQELLANHGIELAPISYQNHSHPACKMIENHLLYVTLPNLLKKEHSIGLMSLREEKTKKFIKMRRFLKAGDFQGVKMFNAIIDSKDAFRYGDEAFVGSYDERIESIHQEFNSPDFNARVMLMHDELHFHTPKNILDLFRKVPQLKSIVCTLVCPSELLVGETKSRNPRIYGFEVREDTLFFFPDNNPSEGYEQKIANSVWPLLSNSISSKDISLRVSVVSSVFAHHLVIIDRDLKVRKKRNFFLKPTCLIMSEIRLLGGFARDAQIERQTMQSILMYLTCLKTPNRESAMAKLRQLEKRALFEDELNFLSEISTTFSRIEKNDGLSLSFKKQSVDLLCTKFPWLMSFFDEERVWQCCLKDFNRELSVKWFEVELLDINVENLINFNFFIEGVKKLPLSDFKEKFVSILDSLFNKTDSFERTPWSAPALDVGFSSILSPSLSFHPGREVSKLREGDRVNLGPFIQKLRNRPCWNYAFDHPPGSLRIDFQVQMSTEDNGTREGVAFCLSDLDHFQEFNLKKDSVRSNSCVFRSIAPQIGQDVDSLLAALVQEDLSDELLEAILDDKALNIVCISELACIIGRTLRGFFEGNEVSFGSGEPIFLELSSGHCTPLTPEKVLQLKQEINGGLLPSLGCVTYEIEVERAERLLKSFCRGSTGVLAKEDPAFKDELKNLEPLLKAFSRTSFINVSYLWGAPGSGKTRALIRKIKDDDSVKAAIVSPRRLLADDWFNAINGSCSKVFTFETFLRRDHLFSNCLVLDELSLLPPGYIELAIMKIFSSRVFEKKSSRKILNDSQALQRKFVNFARNFKVVVIGDPMQARYYSESDEIILSRKHDIDKMTELGANKTFWRSYRMGSWFEKYVDLPCLRSVPDEERKFYSGLSAIKDRKYDAILCAGREDKRDLAGSIPVYTFGESQGLTFNRVLIALTGRILNCNDYHFFVGITRSVKPFDFIVLGETPLAEYVKRSERRLMGFVLREEKIPRERLANLFLSKKVEFVEEEVFGANIQDKSQFDLFIQPFCPLFDFDKIDEPEDEPCVENEVTQKCHLPVVEVDPLTSCIFDKMKEKFEREAFSNSSGFSEQFSDLDKNCLLSDLPAPFRSEAIFPRHQANDSTTFLMGVKKRLRFSNPSTEENELRENLGAGVELADFFLRSLPNKFEINFQDVEEGLNEFVEKRLGKQASQWENHSNRSDIDWALNSVFMFMKSQLCTKAEKMFVDAKAGQTLACFQHIVLFKMGPTLRAIEKGFNRACGEKFYVHSMKNFEALNGFVLENSLMFQGQSVESDYEAFDSSQDSLILAFELALLRRIGVPQSFLSDYRALKTNLGSRLGNFAIMRFTGEFCTFLFNTFANMLFTFLKYEVKTDSRILFAGDDMASLGKLKEARSFDPTSCRRLLGKFRLKAKEERKDFPMFCGWVLTPDGIYKRPSLLWSRLKVMKERGLIKECIDNYLLEMNWAYKLGELLYQYLDEFEMECHYKCVRFFIEHSSMCRGESVKVLKTFGFTFGCVDRAKTRRTPSSSLWDLMLRGPTMDEPIERAKGLRDLSKIKEMDRKSRSLSELLRKALNDLRAVGGDTLNDGSFTASKIRGLGHTYQLSRLSEEGKFPGYRSVCTKLDGHFSTSLGQVSEILKKEFEKKSGQNEDRKADCHLAETGEGLVLPFGFGGRKFLFEHTKIRGLTECLSLKPMNLISTRIPTALKLMQLALGQFTEMQTSCIQKCSSALGDSNQRLKYTVGTLAVMSSRTFQLLMGTSLGGLMDSQRSMATFISGRLSYASIPFSLTPTKCKEKSQSLIKQCYPLSKVTLHHMMLTSKTVLQFSYCSLRTAFHLLIQICSHALRYFCGSLNYQSLRVVNCLALTWGSFSGCRIHQEFSEIYRPLRAGVNRRLQDARSLDLMRNCREKFCALHAQGLSHSELIAKKGAEVFSYLREAREEGLTKLIQSQDCVRRLINPSESKMRAQIVLSETQMTVDLWRQIWGNLGLPRSELIKQELNYLENMSVQEVLRGEIRARVRRFLWDNFVDPDHDLVVFPAGGGPLTGNSLETYNQVSEYYEKFLFGNIAIVGTSSKITWPSVEVPIPEFRSRIGTDDVTWSTELIMSDVCPRLETFRSRTEYLPLKRSTFRNLCEAFADSAREFLNERRQFGVFTNIFSKWPRAFEAAPQVAFDFAGGLNMHELTVDERTVIDRMTKRLFRTEGQKMVFSAQGEVNFNLEG